MSFASRDVIQFLNGDKRGLLGQMAIFDGALKCLCRDMDGKPHIFELQSSDDVKIVGKAAMGPPEPGSMMPEHIPHRLSSEEIDELLEPLPPEIKAQPIDSGESMEFSPEEHRAIGKNVNAPRSRAGLRKSNKKLPRHSYSVKITNGIGEEAVVIVNVREGLRPELMAGAAIRMTKDKLSQIRPFTASDWSLVAATSSAPDQRPATDE